jgi:hypothetical protein
MTESKTAADHIRDFFLLLSFLSRAWAVKSGSAHENGTVKRSATEKLKLELP